MTCTMLKENPRSGNMCDSPSSRMHVGRVIISLPPAHAQRRQLRRDEEEDEGAGSRQGWERHESSGEQQHSLNLGGGSP